MNKACSFIKNNVYLCKLLVENMATTTPSEIFICPNCQSNTQLELLLQGLESTILLLNHSWVGEGYSFLSQEHKSKINKLSQPGFKPFTEHILCHQAIYISKNFLILKLKIVSKCFHLSDFTSMMTLGTIIENISF